MKNEIQFYRCVLLICLCIGMSFYGCQEQILPEPENSETDLVLKKGGKPAADPGELYGDLWQLERDVSGVPVIYPMLYRVDYQDKPVSGHIDVMNPRLTQGFTMDILKRGADGYVVYTTPTDGTDPIPVWEPAVITINVNGFINSHSPIVLYDAEGSILPTAALYVIPVDEGRINLIRSPSDVLTSRMTEVISNFGDGTVWKVTRDFCGRLYMVRTHDALDNDILDKPIDSPLENMAVYKELMLNGFSRPADQNGLDFLSGYSYDVFNLAAACISGASDKSGVLNIDEIVFLNLFLGIPTPGTGILQTTHAMNKTTKQQISVDRWYIDYSGFSYNRNNFRNTYLDLYGIKYVDGSIDRYIIKEDLILDDILSGVYSGDVLGSYRYTTKIDQSFTGAVGFANMADDYVQALEVVHNNEEFLVWDAPTPWAGAWKYHPVVRTNTPFFTITIEEVSHSKRPAGKGDDATTTTDGGGSKGSSGSRGGK